MVSCALILIEHVEARRAPASRLQTSNGRLGSTTPSSTVPCTLVGAVRDRAAAQAVRRSGYLLALLRPESATDHIDYYVASRARTWSRPVGLVPCVALSKCTAKQSPASQVCSVVHLRDSHRAQADRGRSSRHNDDSVNCSFAATRPPVVCPTQHEWRGAGATRAASCYSWCTGCGLILMLLLQSSVPRLLSVRDHLSRSTLGSSSHPGATGGTWRIARSGAALPSHTLNKLRPQLNGS